MTQDSTIEKQEVNFNTTRSFSAKLGSICKETFYPDDPFRQFKREKSTFKAVVQYFIPIFEWLPKYNLNLFKFDLLAGITITSLAIPQGISYAKLASIPPIIGLYSSFVPPLIYAVFGSSKHLAVGTVAACSLIITNTISKEVDPDEHPELYLNLVFTATLISGLFEFALGILRLGIVVDFLSHSTITGFMGGTAVIIGLQQLKGFLGMKHFTTETDVVSVLHAIFKNRHEWRWESAVVGVIFLAFLQFTRFVRSKKPKLFWVSAIAPMVVVIVGGVFAFLIHGEKHGIQVVGKLHQGLNHVSINDLNFDKRYLPAVVKAGLITAIVSMAEGIAIGRSFALKKNEQIDGNKEMVAFGLMNIIGSFFSCYLTTGPFSKTAVNYNAGARTAMSNIVMSVFMMLTLLFLANIFRYTPLVALSTIIISAMLGLIKYKEVYHLFKVDKFDFCICMIGFLGVAFLSMDLGLGISVAMGLLRALLYIARPATCKLGRIPDSILYRDTKQYPAVVTTPGVVALQLGSPIYFANANYMRERILRWIREEQEECSASKGDGVATVVLDLSGVTSIDVTGMETLIEVLGVLRSKDIQMAIVNPRFNVMDKMIASGFVDEIGKENIFLCCESAVLSAKRKVTADDAV